VPVRSEDMYNATGTSAQSVMATEDSEYARPREYSTHLSTNAGNSYAPDASSHSRSQCSKQLVWEGRDAVVGFGHGQHPPDAVWHQGRCRNEHRTDKPGGSAALDPVTPRHGCCEEQQTVLISTSLTSAEKLRMRWQRRTVDADKAVSRGDTSIKTENSTLRSFRKTYESERKAIT
jgi:hypothetical protein